MKVREENSLNLEAKCYDPLMNINQIYKIILKTKDRTSLIERVCEIIESSKYYENAMILLFNNNYEVTEYSLSPLLREKEDILIRIIKKKDLPNCIKKITNENSNFLRIYEDRDICKNCPFLSKEKDCNTFIVKISYNNSFYGVLKVNVKEQSIFEGELFEKNLFLEVAESIGFSLYNYEIAQKRNLIEEKYSKLFGTSPYCIYFSTLGGKFLDVNDACVKMLGYKSKDEITKVDISKDLYYNPEDRKKFIKEIRKGYIHGFRFKVKKKDGTVITIEESSVAIKDRDNNIIGFQGIVKDVTELLKAQEELRKSEEKFRKIFNSLLDIYYQTDIKGVIKMLSPSVERIAGYKPEELIEKNVSQVYLEDREKERFFKRLMDKGEVNEYELKLIKKNGELAVASVNSRLIKDKNGKPIGIEGIIRDITKRVKREETLRILARAIENLDIAFVITNKDEIIEYVNPAYEKITGYKYEEAIGKHPLLIQEAELNEKEVEGIRKAAKDGKVWRSRVKFKRKDGFPYYEEVTVFPVFNRAGELTHYAALKRDITENIKKERELQEKTCSLEEAYKKLKETQTRLIQQEKLASIGTLAAGIAHELNNPIGFIASNLNTLKKYNKAMLEFMELLEDEIKKRERECGEIIELMKKYKKEKHIDFMLNDVKDLVEESLEGVERITTIVKNLRSFSRVDQMGELKEYDIREGIKSTLVIAKNSYKYVAEVKTEFEEVPLIKGFPNELNQVFLNIIVNAAQAIESEGRSEKGLILIKVYEEGEFVCCSIYNDGPAIPEETMNKIFDPFFTTKEAGKGTGLGLNISYDIIVNKHGGELLVENCENGGVKFTIKIPKKIKERGNEDV